MLLLTVVATVFVFGLLIFVHELGHFLVAKATGMRVDEFAIGFGPALISVRRGETLYSLRLVPLGGFNKIAGMEPDEELDERSFNRKPLSSRIAVILAGSVMNFLLPVVLFIIVFWTTGLVTVSDEPVIGEIVSGKPAQQAGIQSGDRIVAINGHPVQLWNDVLTEIRASTDQALVMDLRRQETVFQATVIPEYDKESKRAMIGIAPTVTHQTVGMVQGIQLGFTRTVEITWLMTKGIYQMVTGQTPADVAGPIGVAQMAGQFAQMGIMPLLQFTAFVSLNLGIINLLPVPVLDGGWVLILLIELVRGKPLEPGKENFVKMIGFALIIMLVIFATFKDIVRWSGY